MTDRPLVDLTLTEFAERLALRTPTPGGGSVAAYLAASGAALAAMAFRFTSGEKYVVVEGAMAARVQELDWLRARALALVDLDTRSYDAVTNAYKLAKSSEPEKAARSAAIQAALKGALEVPAETMSVALEALRACVAGIADINPNLVSDCATGAACLECAAESALLNVRINAASIADKSWASARLDACFTLAAEARTLLAQAQSSAAKHLPS